MMMKSKWRIFIVINIITLTAFLLSLTLEVLQVFIFSGTFVNPVLATIFIAAFSIVIYINCTRNISLSKVLVYNKRDITVKPEHTRNLTALFSIAIFFLAYGLIQGYNNFRLSLFTHNLFEIVAYPFQVITVVCGAYIVFRQNALSKLAASILESEINDSIEEIGS